MGITLNQLTNSVNKVMAKIKDKYVPKENDKGLSTNDYTNEDKNKVAKIDTIENSIEQVSSQIDDIENERVNISLKEFGCICDGQTDDTEKFLLAINSVDNNSNLIFNGTVRITQPINLVKNKRINLIGVSNGRGAKSKILFDSVDKSCALFTTLSASRINVFFDLRNIEIVVNKVDGKSVNSLFKGIKFQESTMEHCTIKNFNIIYDNCGASWISKIINNSFTEIGRAFLSNDCLFVDSIITNNYFSGNSSMPIDENGQKVYRCPDFMDTETTFSRISKTNIANNWFEKFGTIFTSCTQSPIVGNTFDYCYTLGRLNTVFSSNVLTNFNHSSFIGQFKNYGDFWSGFSNISYIGTLDSGASIIGNQFFFDIKDTSIKGFNFRNYGILSAENIYYFDNIKLSKNTYGLTGEINKDLLIDFSNIYYNYYNNSSIKKSHLRNMELNDYENIPFTVNFNSPDDYKFCDGMKVKINNIELICKIINNTLFSGADPTTNICHLYDNDGVLHYFKTINLCGGFENITTDKTGVDCKWYLQNSGMVKAEGSSNILLNLYINNNTGAITRSVYCKVTDLTSGYYRFSPCNCSSKSGNTTVAFYDIDDSLLATLQLTEECVFKIPSSYSYAIITQQIKFTDTNVEWVTPASINRYGEPIGEIVKSEKIRLLQVITSDGNVEYQPYN